MAKGAKIEKNSMLNTRYLRYSQKLLLISEATNPNSCPCAGDILAPTHEWADTHTF